jgi:hypothetical protein
MNILEDGAMWHVDQFLGIDKEISGYTIAVAK